MIKIFFLFLSFFCLNLSAMIIDNLNDVRAKWSAISDQVMGGKSELEADYNDGIFSLSGFVTTENNGGFVRLAHRPKNVDQSVKGIRFMAKGNDETYEIHVTMQGMRMPPWAYHSSKFDVSDEWQMFEINFANFEKKSGMSPKLRPNNIRDISFAGYGRNFNVELHVKEISFY